MDIDGTRKSTAMQRIHCDRCAPEKTVIAVDGDQSASPIRAVLVGPVEGVKLLYPQGVCVSIEKIAYTTSIILSPSADRDTGVV